jgi:hypothetical protein
MKIYFFGCSFTELENSPTGYNFTNFRKIIHSKTGIETCKKSKPGKSNQEIFNDVYIVGNDVKYSDNKPVFVIQTTFLDRLGMPFHLRKEFVSICKREKPDNFVESILINFYNDWLKYFYSRSNAKLEFQKQIDFLCSWLRENKIEFVIIGMDESIDLIDNDTFFEKNNFLKFGKYKSFYSYASINQLRIADIQHDNQNPDFHFNQKGHDILAAAIIEKFKLI